MVVSPFKGGSDTQISKIQSSLLRLLGARE